MVGLSDYQCNRLSRPCLLGWEMVKAALSNLFSSGASATDPVLKRTPSRIRFFLGGTSERIYRCTGGRIGDNNRMPRSHRFCQYRQQRLTEEPAILTTPATGRCTFSRILGQVWSEVLINNLKAKSSTSPEMKYFSVFFQKERHNGLSAMMIQATLWHPPYLSTPLPVYASCTQTRNCTTACGTFPEWDADIAQNSTCCTLVSSNIAALPVIKLSNEQHHLIHAPCYGAVQFIIFFWFRPPKKQPYWCITPEKNAGCWPSLQTQVDLAVPYIGLFFQNEYSRRKKCLPQSFTISCCVKPLDPKLSLHVDFIRFIISEWYNVEILSSILSDQSPFISYSRL